MITRGTRPGSVTAGRIIVLREWFESRQAWKDTKMTQQALQKYLKYYFGISLYILYSACGILNDLFYFKSM